MINAQRPEKFSLGSLLQNLKVGQFVIPDFQREFEWHPWDVRELIKSIFLDYYIGTLLLWKGEEKNFEALSCEPIYGFKGESKPQFIALDGQQRLTAIYYACYAPNINFPKRKTRCFYFVDIQLFQMQEYDDAFGYEWLSKRWEKVISDKEEQYRRHVFPIPVLGENPFTLYRWLDGYTSFWEQKKLIAQGNGNESDVAEMEEFRNNAAIFSEYIIKLHSEYQISYIELDKDIGVEKVCDIFTQINSRGIRLDIFDLLNAMLRPKGIYLKSMWRKARNQLNFLETNKMNVYILQVMSILLQAYCSPKYLYFLIPGNPKKVRQKDGTFSQVILIESDEQFKRCWEDAVSAINNTLQILQSPHDYGAISANFIPYPAIIPVFAAIRSEAKKNMKKGFTDVYRKVRKWYWSSIFTNRYSSAAESTSARDFRDLIRWFEDADAIPEVITEFTDGFESMDLKNENKKGSAIYNAIFNLLVIRGAKDWVTLEAPGYDSLDDHHIIPKSWGLENIGVQIHSILNRTPLYDTTNRDIIRDRLPNQYLPEMFEKYGKPAVISLLASHLISEKAIEVLIRDDFGPNDFHEFLEERQKTVKQAIQDLLFKELIEISPNLHDINNKIEKIELGLRSCIMKSIGDDTDAIPQHILQKVDERINRAQGKDPTFDKRHYGTLNGKLEYFDLRDYQDFIINKGLWPKFADRFANKEALLIKFNQLAELRNAIRHSRTLDTIKLKEGEAAIQWFNQTLRLID